MDRACSAPRIRSTRTGGFCRTCSSSTPSTRRDTAWVGGTTATDSRFVDRYDAAFIGIRVPVLTQYPGTRRDMAQRICWN
eukprot:143715-Rhodomonas_salina.3